MAIFTEADFSPPDTLPLLTTKTGTIETEGKIVRGTGTKFLKELIPMIDYIFDGTEIRKVIGVSTDILANLESPFASDIAASSDLKTTRQAYSNVHIQHDSSTTAMKVDDKTLTVGAVIDLKTSTMGRGITPLVINENSGAKFTISATDF